MKTMKKKYFLNDCTASARKIVEMIQSTGLNADCAPAVAAMGEGYPACSRARKIRYAHTTASTWAIKTWTIAWQYQRKKCKWQYAQYVHGKASRTSIHNRYNAQGSAGKHCRDRIWTLIPQILQSYEKGNPKMLQVLLNLH